MRGLPNSFPGFALASKSSYGLTLLTIAFVGADQAEGIHCLGNLPSETLRTHTDVNIFQALAPWITSSSKTFAKTLSL